MSLLESMKIDTFIYTFCTQILNIYSLGIIHLSRHNLDMTFHFKKKIGPESMQVGNNKSY